MKTNFKGLEENFKFMVLEVSKQLEDTRRLLMDSRLELRNKINSRDDYIDNLKNLIETKCFNHHAKNKSEADYVRAIDVISNNLEKIGDYAVTIVKQTTYLSDIGFIRRYDFTVFFKEIAAALKMIDPALSHRNIQSALKICRSEATIDELYRAVWEQIIADLKAGGEDTQNYVTCLFLASNLERIGDALLNIGEAVISSALGEKLKIHQFDSFQEAVRSSDIKIADDQRLLKSMGETKSGCVIDRVQTADVGADRGQGVIFKEGDIKKILKEKENIEKWNKLIPGISPRIFGFHQSGRYGSLLLEFLRWGNLREVSLTGRVELLQEAMKAAKFTVKSVWTKTMDVQPVSANYMGQMTSRIEDVYTAHPEFQSEQAERIGSLEIPSFQDLIEEARRLEAGLKAPFGVMIHGDFNIDNLMFDPVDKKIHYIDLYRSAVSDYLQDVSVFIVSNFRTPVFDKTLRGRLNWVTLEFYQFARAFAEKNNDMTFDARLALGLSRSFITSTRFEFNKDFAHVMYLRSIYLLEKFIEHKDKPWEEFRIPEDALVY